MNVLLISANTERINMVSLPLGLGQVAASARRAGHRVNLIDLLSPADPVGFVRDALISHRPDVIGISIRNIDDQNAQEPRFLLEKAKKVVEACRTSSRAPIILGGAGYSIFPVEALSYLSADFGVCGDGEDAFIALLDRLERKLDPEGVRGVYVAGRQVDAGRASAEDLNSAPLWDEALRACADPANDDLWVPVQSRRGCPNDCSYCSTSRIQGRPIRCRSPRLVVDAVGNLSKLGYNRFYFVDNSFNIPEAHALHLCRLLSELSPRVTWRCILYPQHVTEELVKAMARAGCVEVSLGFESGAASVLRQMNKRFSPIEVRRICDLLASQGIRRFGFLLLGGPGETRETVEESLDFARSLGLDGLRITIGIRIYPGTPLARRACAEGVISDEKSLLLPRFYLAPGLVPWIHQVARGF
jgi:radical SAM superfamily enzyme YgiQ (UPF0313 family)